MSIICVGAETAVTEPTENGAASAYVATGFKFMLVLSLAAAVSKSYIF